MSACDAMIHDLRALQGHGVMPSVVLLSLVVLVVRVLDVVVGVRTVPARG